MKACFMLPAGSDATILDLKRHVCVRLLLVKQDQ